MKRILLIVSLTLIQVVCFGQKLNQKVGSNPTVLHTSAALEVESTSKGFLPPRMTQSQMNAVSNPATGLLVYCTNCSTPGLYVYNGNSWESILGSNSATSVLVSCSSNAFTGNFYNGVAMGTNKFSVTITNNSFTTVTISFQTSDLVLSGVSGISVAAVSIPSVTLNSGQSQVVEYTLSGVPSSTGTLTGAWSKLALNCTKTVVVTNPPISGTSSSYTSMTGTLTEGIAASGVSFVIAYGGGDGSAYSGQSIASTEVTGLTATLAPGNFATGSGSVTYTITGTPNKAGSARFFIELGGWGVIVSIPVNFSFNIPETITIEQFSSYYIHSVFDQDYLPYTAPSNNATTNTQAADGSNEAVTVNVQGTISTTGVNIKIPVTATGSGTLPAYSQPTTIPANMTEDGISRDLILSWAEQAYTTSTTTINANLKAVGGTLNAKKLDINAGVGTEPFGVFIGSFTYPYNNAGYITSFAVGIIPGIPDKMFGLPDNNSNSATHMMLYLPTVAEDGRIWLNNNLGAHYANINHASFNPAQQAISATDHLAYGSLFQWGRKPDGHELITYTNGSTATPVNGISTTNSNAPADALFIIEPNSPFDWRSTLDSSLWATLSSTDNPCPVGFRVPTQQDFNLFVTKANITNSTTANSSILKFTVPGYRNYSNGTLSSVGINAYYWTVTNNGVYSGWRSFYTGGTDSSFDYRANGFSVRCIKN